MSIWSVPDELQFVAIGSRLLFDPRSNDTLENAITEFVNNTHDSSTVALQKLLSEVKPIVRPKILKPIGVFTYLYMDPISFETFLVSMFSNPSSEEAHILCEGIEWYYLSIWDFKIVRFLLKEEHTFVKHRILNKILSRLNDEVIPFTGRFFKYSLDIEVMKLAVSIDDDDADDGMRQLKDMAFTVINNSILLKSAIRRREMSQDDPLFSYTMAFHALYTEHIPDEYPGEVDWVRCLFDKDSIEQYWVDEPAMLRMWKVAFFKALKWVQELEKAGIVSDYLLLSRIVQGEDVRKHPNSPINDFSLGPFLVMKSVDFGGAVAMSVRLGDEGEGIMTDLFYDFYSFLKLYRAGFPASVDYSDRVLAARHSQIG